MGRSAVYTMCLLSALFLLAALFVYVYKIASLEFAFLSVGTVFVLTAVGLAIWTHYIQSGKSKSPLPESMKDDALASYIPDAVANDPFIRKILKEIGNNPVPATATAVTIGMLLSREYFDGD